MTTGRIVDGYIGLSERCVSRVSCHPLIARHPQGVALIHPARAVEWVLSQGHPWFLRLRDGDGSGQWVMVPEDTRAAAVRRWDPHNEKDWPAQVFRATPDVLAALREERSHELPLPHHSGHVDSDGRMPIGVIWPGPKADGEIVFELSGPAGSCLLVGEAVMDDFLLRQPRVVVQTLGSPLRRPAPEPPPGVCGVEETTNMMTCQYCGGSGLDCCPDEQAAARVTENMTITDAINAHRTTPHTAGSCSYGYGPVIDELLDLLPPLDDGEYVAIALACLDQAGLSCEGQAAVVAALRAARWTMIEGDNQ